MSIAPLTDGAAIDDSVTAEMIWNAPHSAPEVMLSFQGLREPITLWQELSAIGWFVPPCPPRPGSAIEWVPDPVAGTDYTILPWRVNEFRLGEGAWTRDQAAAVGAFTFDLFRRHSVHISGSRTQILALAERPMPATPERLRHPATTMHAPVTPATRPVPEPQERAAPRATTAPAPAATATPEEEPGGTAAAVANGWVLFFDMDSSARDATVPGLTNWIGVSGRTKESVDWTELAAGPGETVPSATVETLAATSRQAWFVEGSLPPVPASPSHSAFQMLIPGMTAEDGKVKKLEKFLGQSMTTHPLLPMREGTVDAVLVAALVPTNSYAMLDSNLRLRMPAAIVRTES